MEKAYLILEDGSIFEGKSFGAKGTKAGELVFTTQMTGCTEQLTDPNYGGQVVLFTFPQLANYGICLADRESKACHLSAVVVREYCKSPSNFRCDMDVETFLKEENVVALAGIDTRHLTQLIRDKGTMQAIVTTENPAVVPLSFSNPTLPALETVSSKESYTLLPEGTISHHVALLDYGVKNSLLQGLLSLGFKVSVFPYDTKAQTILSPQVDGVILSNGPGRPIDNPLCIQEIRDLLGKIPLFGLGLGHQMLALAVGGKVKKLPLGHHGGNQPVKDLQSGSISITSQNHDYEVDSESLSGTPGSVRFVNVNDGSCEGIAYPSLKALSLQYLPDMRGSANTAGIVKDFIAMMEGHSHA